MTRKATSKATNEGPTGLDEAAFADLFHALYALLVQYADRLVHNKVTAQDLVQEAFLRLWNKRAALDPRRSIRALLYVTVRNLALNQERNLATRKTLLEKMERPDQPPSPEDTAHARLVGHQLRSWIQELPARRQEAFQLSRFDGLRYEEIADVMGISIKTVENHIREALRFLRSRLREYAPETLL